MITPTFNRPADIQGTDQANDVSFWNSKFNPVYDFVDSISNHSQVVITGDYTVTKETHLFVDCSGGNITITLPTNTTQPIVITKIDGTFNDITLTSSIFIERFGDFSVSPSQTTAKIAIPKQSITYLIVSNKWRIVDSYAPTVTSHVRLGTNMDNLPVSNDNHILFTQKSYDPFNLYSLATSNFVAPLTGIYLIESKLASAGIVAANVNNGCLLDTTARIYNGATQIFSEQLDSSPATNTIGVRSGNGMATLGIAKGNTVRITARVFGSSQSVFMAFLLSRAVFTLVSYEH